MARGLFCQVTVLPGSVPKHKGVFPTVDSTLGLELSEPDLDQQMFTCSTSEKAQKKYLNKDTTTGYKFWGNCHM
jgi:hypothetical protein